MNEAQLKPYLIFMMMVVVSFKETLNRNIQSNPQFAQAYAERFPKTALAMKGLPMLFQGCW